MATGINEIRFLFIQGRFHEALNKCDEILREDTDNVDVIIMKAQILAIPDPEISDPSIAINILKNALTIKPNCAELHEALGNVYELGIGNYVKAAKEYKKTIQLNPKKSKTLYTLAALYQHPGVQMSNEEALAYLQKAITLEPCNWEIRRELGTRWWESGNREKAKSEYEAALKCIPPPDDLSRKQIEDWLKKVEKNIVFKDGYREVIS